MAMKAQAPVGAPAASPKPWWLAAAGLIAVLAVLVATAYGRGTLPAETRDPGALVRWGYGVAQTVQNMTAAATIGALVFATFIVPPGLSGPVHGNPVSERFRPQRWQVSIPAFARIMAAGRCGRCSLDDLRRGGPGVQFRRHRRRAGFGQPRIRLPAGLLCHRAAHRCRVAVDRHHFGHRLDPDICRPLPRRAGRAPRCWPSAGCCR